MVWIKKRAIIIVIKKGAGEMDKLILIVGGSGFIGQGILREGVKTNNQFISVSKSGNKHVSTDLKQHTQITWLASDIFSDNKWLSFLPKVDTVINLVGILSASNEKMYHLNVEANQIILDQLQNYPKIQFIYLSASSGGPFSSNKYVEAKLISEANIRKQLVFYCIIRSGLVVDIARPVSVLQGLGLFILIPFFKKSLQKVTPISRKKLATFILEKTQLTDSLIINLWKKAKP